MFPLSTTRKREHGPTTHCSFRHRFQCPTEEKKHFSSSSVTQRVWIRCSRSKQREQTHAFSHRCLWSAACFWLLATKMDSCSETRFRETQRTSNLGMKPPLLCFAPQLVSEGCKRKAKRDLLSCCSAYLGGQARRTWKHATDIRKTKTKPQTIPPARSGK